MKVNPRVLDVWNIRGSEVFHVFEAGVYLREIYGLAFVILCLPWLPCHWASPRKDASSLLIHASRAQAQKPIFLAIRELRALWPWKRCLHDTHNEIASVISYRLSVSGCS